MCVFFKTLFPLSLSQIRKPLFNFKNLKCNKFQTMITKYRVCNYLGYVFLQFIHLCERAINREKKKSHSEILML